MSSIKIQKVKEIEANIGLHPSQARVRRYLGKQTRLKLIERDNTALEVTGYPKVRYVSCFILNSLCFWFSQCQQSKTNKQKNILSVHF